MLLAGEPIVGNAIPAHRPHDTGEALRVLVWRLLSREFTRRDSGTGGRTRRTYVPRGTTSAVPAVFEPVSVNLLPTYATARSMTLCACSSASPS